MAKGQIITSDFIAGAAVFMIAVTIIVPLFSQLSQNAVETQFSEDAQTRLFFAADSVLKTQGAPNDWTPATVTSIGVADENGRINTTKIRSLTKLDVTTVRTLTGLIGLQYNISFYNGQYYAMTGGAVSPAAYFYVNGNKLFGYINGSGLAWDLYYGGAGTPETGDAANLYTGPTAALFDSMTSNGSAYRTIIVEDPALTQPDVNITALKEFVRTGGILIYAGDAALIASGFSMSSASGANETGLVADINMIEAPYNSTVAFDNAQWYFYNTSGDAPMNVMVSSSSGAYIGKWRHGIGHILYMTDAGGEANGMQLRNISNAIGKKAEAVSGTMLTTFVNSRAIVFNTDINSIGKAVIAVGR